MMQRLADVSPVVELTELTSALRDYRTAALDLAAAVNGDPHVLRALRSTPAARLETDAASRPGAAEEIRRRNTRQALHLASERAAMAVSGTGDRACEACGAVFPPRLWTTAKGGRMVPPVHACTRRRARLDVVRHDAPHGSQLLATWLGSSGTSTADLAGVLAVHRATVYGWLRGEHIPTLEVRDRLLYLAGIDPLTWLREVPERRTDA